MIDSLLNWVAPHLCVNCGRIGSLLCADCKSYITEHPFVNCVVCEKADKRGICPKHKAAYSKAWVVGSRQDGLRTLIDVYKFHNARAGAAIFAELLDVRLPEVPANTIVIAIPTINKHIRQRGYDHARLIARRFARRRHLTMVPLLKRQQNSIQKQANKKQRRTQAQHAFKLALPIDANRPYLIVDDVVTTGATLHYAAQLLKDAGAHTIWVGAIAHQPLD